MADIAELIVALKLRDGVSPGLGRLNGQLRGMQGGLSQVSRGVGQVAGGLDRALTRGAIAAAAGLGAVVTTAASFEQAFTGVEKTVEGTDAQMAELEETLRGMARTMPVSFEELAAIGEQGGALGIARESLDEFVDVVARLAVSTDLSSEQAATSLGQLGNVLQLSGDEYERFADILVALGNDGASTESQIIDLAARFGAAGNAAGLTNEQILALASTTASMGIEAEAGGGALSRIFNNLTLDMATASDEGKLLADTLGVSLDELKRAWETDAGGVFEDLLAHINELDQFEGAALLSNLGITNTRDINAIRLLSQGIGEYQDQLGTANDKTKALREESDKFFGTATANFEKLKNIGRDSLAVIAEDDLLPAVNEELERLAADLNKPEVREGLRAFGRDLADGFRAFMTEVRSADFGPLLDTMKGAAAIAKGAFDAFRSLPQPIQQLALAAIVANKVTGGAVGQIAGGLGNIVGGALKISLAMRGSSPANPLFVSAVGGGLGGGPGGVGGKGGGKGGPLGLLGGLLGVTAAAAFADEFSDEISGFGVQLHDELGIADPPKWLKDFLDWSPFKQQGTTVAGARSVGPTVEGPPIPATRDADQIISRFGGKLDKLATNEVIEHLARTTETGLKGVGNSFQVGIQTGLDPIGDVATRILARAEDPKAPPVMAEIKGHIAGLEEIQATYLATGDIALANKVQTNIETLHALIGTVDTTNAVTAAEAARAASSDAAMIATAGRVVAETQALNQSEGTRAAATQARLDAAKTAIHTLNSSEGIRSANLLAVTQPIASSTSRTAAATEREANKPPPVFDPKITVPVQNFVTVSATVLQQRLVNVNTVSGTNRYPTVR